jgi:hypothetical protein
VVVNETSKNRTPGTTAQQESVWSAILQRAPRKISQSKTGCAGLSALPRFEEQPQRITTAYAPGHIKQ